MPGPFRGRFLFRWGGSVCQCGLNEILDRLWFATDQRFEIVAYGFVVAFFRPDIKTRKGFDQVTRQAEAAKDAGMDLCWQVHEFDRLAGGIGNVARNFGMGDAPGAGQVIGFVYVIGWLGQHHGGGFRQVIARDIGDFGITRRGAEIAGFKRVRDAGQQQVCIKLLRRMVKARPLSRM